MKTLVVIVFSLLLISCGQDDAELPVVANPLTGAESAQVPAFRFINQNGDTVSEKTFEGKFFVADFIFLNCGTICPKMNQEMLRVYKTFQNEDRLLLISHSIDPLRDSVAALRNFAEGLGVAADKWHFVTGNIDSIYKLAEKNYFTAAYPDSSEAGNFIHGGALLLVDDKRHIRGVYDGTNELETMRLIGDIKLVLKH